MVQFLSDEKQLNILTLVVTVVCFNYRSVFTFVCFAMLVYRNDIFLPSMRISPAQLKSALNCLKTNFDAALLGIYTEVLAIEFLYFCMQFLPWNCYRSCCFDISSPTYSIKFPISIQNNFLQIQLKSSLYPLGFVFLLDMAIPSIEVIICPWKIHVCFLHWIKRFYSESWW